MDLQHIGWCNIDGHDKVWGIMVLARGEYDADTNSPWPVNKYVTFWGRRGKKLQTKLWEGSYWEAENAFEAKINKGYDQIDRNQLDDVYPEFQQDLEKTAFWATFKI